MKTLSALQAWRALAALLVVATHAGRLASARFGPGELDFLFGLGDAGISFFFVLSGFVMVWAHEEDFGRPKSLVPYFRKRVLRIYPVYVFVTLLLLPAWLAFPEFGEARHREFVPLIKSLLLVPQAHPPHLVVGWTLTHEVLFYLLFGAMILARALGAILMAPWTVAVLAGEISGLNADFPANFFLSAFNLLFPLGMLAAFMARRLSALSGPAGLWVYVAGNLMFLSILVFATDAFRPFHVPLLYGAAALLILAGAVNPSVEGFFRERKTLLFLGAASYSLYLIHYPAMSLAAKGLPLATGERTSLHPVAGFLLLSAAGAFAGVLLHLAVERPLLARLRGLFRDRARA
jgi:peptidoglycan/LPS O-acetylase OafA/YrhL